MSSIVECVNLTKSFGPKTALDQINLTLKKGRIIGLLGPNGSGKTTLLKLITGLLQPTTGEVLIQGNLPGPESKAIISYLPDRTYLSDWMRVSEIFTFF